MTFFCVQKAFLHLFGNSCFRKAESKFFGDAYSSVYFLKRHQKVTAMPKKPQCWAQDCISHDVFWIFVMTTVNILNLLFFRLLKLFIFRDIYSSRYCRTSCYCQLRGLQYASKHYFKTYISNGMTFWGHKWALAKSAVIFQWRFIL